MSNYSDCSAELLDDILLSMVEGVGSRTVQQLLERFGSSTTVLDAARSDLSGFQFLKPETTANLVSARRSLDPSALVELCRRERIDIVPFRDSRYPEPLRTIHDPPPILYIQGRLLPRDAFSLAVIGTRRASAYGRRQTERLTSALARSGFSIVSGLARGIDAVAHRAALQAGGRTIAVLGSGHCRLYPPEHQSLAEQIIETDGAVLSEYPPLHESAKWTFPQRNRIISGLSLGVLVVEAPRRSGAMISARMAGEQGRDIFAVPGPIESEGSRGTHQLIRDGAYLVDSVDDILDVLGPMPQPVSLPGLAEPIRHPGETALNEIEQTVLRHVGTATTALEDIVARSGLARHQVVAALGALEERRIIRRVSATSVVRM